MRTATARSIESNCSCCVDISCVAQYSSEIDKWLTVFTSANFCRETQHRRKHFRLQLSGVVITLTLLSILYIKVFQYGGFTRTLNPSSCASINQIFKTSLARAQLHQACCSGTNIFRFGIAIRCAYIQNTAYPNDAQPSFFNLISR